MDIKQLKYFSTIAEEGQITSAARRLHIAQPPLSQQLKLLEQELGVQLFERASSGLRITSAGSYLLRRSYEVLSLMEEIEADVSTFRDGSEGTLKIGMISSAGSILLDESFLAFQQAYPKVRFHLYEGNSLQVIEYLQKNMIEIGIVRTPFDYTTFQKSYWKQTPMIAVWHQTLFPLHKANSVSLKELSDYPIIINRRYHQLLQATCSAEQISLNYFCLTNDARTTLQWADAGLGIAIVPQETIRLQNYPAMYMAKIEQKQLYTQLCAIWEQYRPLSKIARNFLDYFKSSELAE